MNDSRLPEFELNAAADTARRRVLALGQPKHLSQIEQACTRAGHEVLPATSIAASMALLHANSVDLIICETFLEWESVFEFLRQVRATPQYDSVRFMMLCADAGRIAKLASHSVEQAASALGVDRYLFSETFDVETLSSEIELLLPTGEGLVEPFDSPLPTAGQDNKLRSLGSALASCRHALGISIHRLSEEISLSPSFVSRVEAGDQDLDVETLQDWCEVLGLNVLDFLEIAETLSAGGELFCLDFEGE